MFGFRFGFGFKNYGTKSEGEKLAEAYKTRVEADGGTYENNDCLIASLDRLEAIATLSFFLLADNGFLLLENGNKIII